MARYFFDTQDGDRFLADDIGIDCATRDVVRSNAMVALPEIALDAMPNGDEYEASVIVRDDRGRTVFRTTLVLRADWVETD